VKEYSVIIIGSGPAGLGAAFHLAGAGVRNILLIEKLSISSGGLRNDCKQNYTFPVGFPVKHWTEEESTPLLDEVASILKPEIQKKQNIDKYMKRSERLGVKLLDIRQAHVGTDKSVPLINSLTDRLRSMGVEIRFSATAAEIKHEEHIVTTDKDGDLRYKNLIIAPGRSGYSWLQGVMKANGISFIDNIVDIGIRVEAREENYRIVNDYYDPKFIFPEDVRTFCTNSGSAHIVKEKYENYYSVNGHSFSTDRKPNGLVNFALLKTIRLTDPVVSGAQFAEILGQMAMRLSGGEPMMQRIGDFRLGRRSKDSSFNDDLYDFEPTLKSATPGDISLAMPGKILRHIWCSLKLLDTIVPGIMHPSTIMYYPEIKAYSNQPEFINHYFEVREHLFMCGDGAGTSRGITAAWASGIRSALGVLKRLEK